MSDQKSSPSESGRPDPVVSIRRKAGQEVFLDLPDGRHVRIIPVWQKNEWGEYLTLNIQAPRDVAVYRGEKARDRESDQSG